MGKDWYCGMQQLTSVCCKLCCSADGAPPAPDTQADVHVRPAYYQVQVQGQQECWCSALNLLAAVNRTVMPIVVAWSSL